MFKVVGTTISTSRKISSTGTDKLFTQNPLTDQSIPGISNELFTIDSDNNLEITDNSQSEYQEQVDQPLDKEVQFETHLAQNTASHLYLFPPNPSQATTPIDNQQNDSKERKNLTLSQESQVIPSSIEQSSDSKFPNYSTNITDSFFSKDEIQPYLQGRGNLSSIQEAQIQAYLAKQSSSDYNILSTYSKSTNQSFENQREEDLLINEDAYSRDYESKRPLSDPKFSNRPISTADTIISENDIQTYLDGRGNLSSRQVLQIQVYLAKQTSSDYNILSKYTKSTNRPIRISTYDDLPSKVERDKDTSLKEDIQSHDYISKQPLSDSKFLNDTTDAEEKLFSDDDLQSYLQGRGNLSQIQEAQIQAYLAKQTSSDRTLFSKYLTSTKQPTRIFPPDDNAKSVFPTEDNASFTKDTQSQDHVSKPSLLDAKQFNLITDTKEKLFSDDDLQSYLQGRGNLSKTQEAQIQAYLEKQSSSNSNILSKYLTTAKNPSSYSGDKNPSLVENDYSEELPPSDSKHTNLTTDTEEIFFSDDNLQSYLQRRGNLSKFQERQIQAYLAKQSTLNNNIFSRFFSSTGSSTTKILTLEDKLQLDSEEKKNLSQNQQILSSDFKLFSKDLNSTTNRFQSSDSTSQKLTSTIPFTTRKRTRIKQPTQSVLKWQ